jgi:hypothetical protein
VNDEEFIEGRLDTGFIARFNERRAANERGEPSQVEIDLAAIAAALSFSSRGSSTPNATNSSMSRWKLAGRVAGVRTRPPSAQTLSSKWRKP